MKKAYIDQILWGFVLIAGIIIFIATINDEIVVHNKISNIRTITDNAALAAGKYYTISKDETESEAIAINIIEGSKLADEIKDRIYFDWQFINKPYYVNAILDSYSQETFWYRFLDKEYFVLDKIYSQAELDLGEVFPPNTLDLAPLAINNCNRTDLVEGVEMTFEFVISPYYAPGDNDTFYAVDKDCSFPTGNSNFAYFKNLFNNNEIDFTDYDMEHVEEGCLVDTSFQNPLSVDPMQLYNSLKHFDYPYAMDMLTFDCGTDKNNLNIASILSVTILEQPTLTAGPKIDGKKSNILIIKVRIGKESEVILNIPE